MPSLEELRERLVGRFQQVCHRTGMYVPDARAAEVSCRELLEVLAYVDDCEQAYAREMSRRRRDDFGSTGAESMLWWFASGDVQVEGHDLTVRSTGNAEVAAWYAELAALFGWLDVPRLSAHDLASVVTALCDPDRIDAWTRGRLVAELPAASIVVGKTVYCYAPPEPDARWVFVDVLSEWGPPWDRPEAPVRSYRTAGPRGARSAMVVSTLGRQTLTPRAALPAGHSRVVMLKRAPSGTDSS
ncbi:hypothetical protein [Cellulomonas xiejunii]|uniref:Uncharacterized protein n=1 Tax=Cellulomonas xiejunii TaxID=2968083 RepID=A0ABY5KPD1_9CELL|nr:hypothetical protein [Cellulomonas xiejunii]MCC2322280.1 hypothetical protein [Cellulomonas xiejunii]UUI72334.1 hypothetical protein NP048_02365 [Cellulomonas xiejunii]